MTTTAARAVREETERLRRPLEDEGEPPIPDGDECTPLPAGFDVDDVGRAFGEAPPPDVERQGEHDQLRAPTLSIHGDVYRFVWDIGVEAELDRLSEHRGELGAELTIRSSRQPRPGLLHSACFSFMSTRARADLGRALAKRLHDVEWDELLEQLCFLARERYREGDPAIDMREYVAPANARWLIEPFVERNRPTVLFADGGSGKSLLALGMAVTAATGRDVVGQLHGDSLPVLYLDLEVDAAAFSERLDAILAGAGISRRPPIFYRRASASLIESAPALRREISERGIGFVVIDSIGPARNGEPESAELTIRLFNAARSLEVPWLGIDHVTKAQGNAGSRPFGSTYTHNLAGLTWGLDVAQDEEANAIAIALVNHKRNAGRRLARRGLRIEFDVTEADELRGIRFRHQDIADVPGLAEKLPLRQRILAELRTGPMASEVLAEELGVDEKQVRSRVGELVSRGELVRLEDRRVAIAARESA